MDHRHSGCGYSIAVHRADNNLVMTPKSATALPGFTMSQPGDYKECRKIEFTAPTTW
jgi:hypothetical protein